MQMSPEHISMLLQEFLRIYNCYSFEYQDTDQIYEHFLNFKDLPQGKRIGAMESAVNELGVQLNQILVDSFNKKDFNKDFNIILPFLPVEELQDLFLVLVIVNIGKKELMMVTLNPEMTIQQLKTDTTSKLLQEFIYNLCVKVVNPGDRDKFSPAAINVSSPQLTGEVNEFLLESAAEPNLRYIFLCWLMYYENSSDTYDITAFRKNLEIEYIDLKHATRFVVTHESLIKSDPIVEKIGEYAETFLIYTEKINQTQEIQIINVMSQETKDQADLLAMVEDAVGSMKDILSVK